MRQCMSVLAKGFVLLLSPIFLSCDLCSAQDVRTPVTIQVLMLNAKTGKPVANKGVNVFIKGVRATPNVGTDANGIAIFTVQPDAEIAAATNWGVTCNAQQADYVPPAASSYESVAKILSEGIVVANTCGKAKSEPVKGRLTIFVRKMTFWEALKT